MSMLMIYENFTKGRIAGGADLVTYWVEKAREMISKDQARRAGLLTTNSIRGGANRRVLDRVKQSGDIFFAESDRSWILEGAAVRVSMVGFDNGEEQHRTLDGAVVDAIVILPELSTFPQPNSYLKIKGSRS